MKTLIQLLILLPSMSLANVCKTENANLKKYNEQKSWQEVQIQEPDVLGEVQGYFDSKNNFYPLSMNRREKYRAQLKVDKNNPEYKGFYKLCQQPNRKQYLSTFRETGKGNQYSVLVKYLPKPKDMGSLYSNVVTTSYELSIDYKPTAILNQLHDGEEVKRMVYQRINSQISQQTEIGQYDIDLSNLDDFVCDLIHGDAQIGIYRRMHSKVGFIEKRESLSAESLFAVYNSWQEAIQSKMSREEKIFEAGSIVGRLQEKGLIIDVNNEKAMTLLKKVMGPNLTEFKTQSTSSLRCILDDMQDYEENFVNHLINVEFVLDKDTNLYPEGL